HEAHRQPRFADEEIEETRIARALGPHALDDQPLLDPRRATPREVDLGHPASGERSEELVATQRTGHRQHYSVRLTPAPDRPKLSALALPFALARRRGLCPRRGATAARGRRTGRRRGGGVGTWRQAEPDRRGGPA